MKNLDPPYRLDQRAHTASSWYEEPSLCRCRIFPKRRECGKGRRQAIESFSFHQLGPTYYHVYDGLSKKVYMTISTRVNTLGANTTCYLLFWSNHRKRTWDSMWYSLQRLREKEREREDSESNPHWWTYYSLSNSHPSILTAPKFSFVCGNGNIY